MIGDKLCSGGFIAPDDGPCPECGAGPDDYCRRPARSATQVQARLEREVIRLRAELLGYQEEAQSHGKNIELRDTEITRLRAELTHEKCLREQAEALCVVLRAHREEYAAQVIEGHAEIANITADNKRLRAELAQLKRDTLAWLPIETAPKDRTDILLRSRHGTIANGMWEPAAYAGNGCWVWPYVYIEPSYWMPIPALVALAAEEAK